MVIDFIMNLFKMLGPYYNGIISILILLLAVYVYIRYDVVLLASIRRSLCKVNKELKNIKDHDLNNLKKIDLIFEETIHPSLLETWTYYYKDFENIPVKDICPNIKEYFDVNTVITIPSRRNKVQVMPAILITIGLLGTVLSLAITLTNIDLSIGVGVQGGLSNLAESFTISILAILSSVALQLLDKQLYHKTIKELYIFQNLVRSRIPMINEALSLERMSREHKNQSEALEKLGGNIADRLNYFINYQMVPSINQTFEVAIKSQLIPSIDRMGELVEEMTDRTIKNQTNGMNQLVEGFMRELNKRLGNQFQVLSKAVYDFSMIHRNMKNTLEVLLKDINHNIGIQSNISSTTEGITKTLVKSQNQMLQLSKNTGENFEKIYNTLETLTDIMSSNEQMLLKINEQRVELQNENNGYFDKINTQIYKLQDDLHTEIESIFSRFTDIMTDTFEKLEQNTKGTMEGLTQHSQTVLSNMDEQVFNMGLSAKEINQEIRDLNTTLENSMKVFNQQMHTGIMETFETFDKGLGEIYSRFSRTIVSISDSIEELPMVIEQLKEELSGTREKAL